MQSVTAEVAEEFTRALGKTTEGVYELILHAHKTGVPKALGLTTPQWVKQRLGGYQKLDVDDRREIALRLKADEDMSTREIAGVLGVDHVTVMNDLRAGENSPTPQISESNTGEFAPLFTDPNANRRDALRDAGTPELPARRYRCIVLDPPWPMVKIDRDLHPEQWHELDYPTMTTDEITNLPIAGLSETEGAHIYLWVTQRFLPVGLKMLDKWGFRYQCQLTWLKPGGMTPYSWQYNTEHILFGTHGKLPLTRLGLKLGFAADRAGHSIKPDEFYQRVVEASPGPRLEMFARTPRDGFDVWGNEV